MKSLGIFLGLIATAGAVAQGAPLKGDLPNANPTSGGNVYRFEDHPRKVFVFHVFDVEVC